ncbi:hypothetical protein BC826DRAFT_576479 [Russula brevipes]|nr:hypothetical protein BC826DRAFT_576479 [Russula brevipes]
MPSSHTWDSEVLPPSDHILAKVRKLNFLSRNDSKIPGHTAPAPFVVPRHPNVPEDRRRTQTFVALFLVCHECFDDEAWHRFPSQAILRARSLLCGAATQTHSFSGTSSGTFELMAYFTNNSLCVDSIWQGHLHQSSLSRLQTRHFHCNYLTN